MGKKGFPENGRFNVGEFVRFIDRNDLELLKGIGIGNNNHFMIKVLRPYGIRDCVQIEQEDGLRFCVRDQKLESACKDSVDPKTCEENLRSLWTEEF